MVTYTATHIHTGKKVKGLTAAQKQSMVDTKAAKNFTFLEEAGAEKPAVVKPAATADKPVVVQK